MITVSTDVIASSTLVTASRMGGRKDSGSDLFAMLKKSKGAKPRRKKRDPLERILSDASMLESDTDDEKATARLSSGFQSRDGDGRSLFVKRKTSAPLTCPKSGSGLTSMLSRAAPTRSTRTSFRGADGHRSAMGTSADDAFYDALGLTGYGRGGRPQVDDLDFDSDDSDIAMFRGTRSGSGSGGRRGGGDRKSDRVISVFFEEYLDTPIEITVPSVHTSVSAFVTDCLQQWFTKHSSKPLKGHEQTHYDVYTMDDDEIDKDQAYGHDLPVLGLGESHLGLAANGRAVPRPTTRASRVSAGEAERIARLDSIAKAFTLLRVRVPGPGARVLTLRFDEDQESMPLRELFFELNRKKQEVYFHAMYFELYYEGESLKGEALPNSTRIAELKKPSLIVLPKHVSESDPHRDDAFQYPLVKLAYKYQEWKANKIRSGKKKGRILGVDYYKITKQAIDAVSTSSSATADESAASKVAASFMSSFSRKVKKTDHVPIDIIDVAAVSQMPDDPPQVKLTYRHPRNGMTTHYYEMMGSALAKDFVDKINFLVDLHKLRP